MAVMSDLFMSKFVPIATCIICMFCFLIIRHIFTSDFFVVVVGDTDILTTINSQVGVGLASWDGM